MRVNDLVKGNKITFVKMDHYGDYIYKIEYNNRPFEFPISKREMAEQGIVLSQEESAEKFVKYIKRHLYKLY